LCPCTVSIDQNRTHAQLTILKEQKQVGEEGKEGRGLMRGMPH